MFDSKNDFSISKIAKSMKRQGFSQTEIYDIFTGAGLPRKEIQLLLDRIDMEYEKDGLDPKPTRLGKEVKTIFKDEMKKIKTDLMSENRIIKGKINKANKLLENLEERVNSLEALISADFEDTDHSKDEIYSP